MSTHTHLDAVFGDQTGWVFIGIGTGQHLTATGKVKHKDWVERSFRWPAQTDDIIDTIARAVDAGADVYFTPSLAENPVREKPNDNPKHGRKPRPVRCLWADLDNNYNRVRLSQLRARRGCWLVASGSGPDHWHLYVPLIEPAAPDVAADLLRRLAAYLGADPAPAWHGAYLRPASTKNWKPAVLTRETPGEVRFEDGPSDPVWTVDDLDDLLPPVERTSAMADIPDAEPVDGDLPAWLEEVIGEPVTAEMDRSDRTMAAVGACRRAYLTDGQIITVMRRHAPTIEKYDGRADKEVARVLAKVPPQHDRAALVDAALGGEDRSVMTTCMGCGESFPVADLATHERTCGTEPCTLADAHEVFRKWMGDEYDIDALNASLAVAAAEQLDGDPVWLLVLSGSGNAKTETVQALAGAGARVKSTLTGEAALLSGTPRRERAKDAHGGILRQIGDRGLLVIKDVTSILSMNRDARSQIIAALREIHDGHWVRDMGGEGGRTLEWKGRIGIIGAVTTAWDRAHDVIASMGDRFVILRMDSTSGRAAAGRKAIANTSHETTMRTELAAAAAGVLVRVDPTKAITVTDDETDLLLAAADLVTLARTGVDCDYKGNVIDNHAPEMPTRFAKELTQVVRGAVAIGMDRTDALRLAIRCARDSMPPLRLKILDDVAANPTTSAAATRKRLEKPWSTIDRQLQSLYILGVLTCEEVEDAKGWRYRLADGIDPTALVSPDLSPPTPSPSEERKERERNNNVESEAPPVPPSDKSGDGAGRACTQCGGFATDISALCASCLNPGLGPLDPEDRF